MAFRDQLLRCGACGKEFVYTVREQRTRQQMGLPTDAPSFCGECRGADVRLAEASGHVDIPMDDDVKAPVNEPGRPRSDGRSNGSGRAPGAAGGRRPPGRDKSAQRGGGQRAEGRPKRTESRGRPSSGGRGGKAGPRGRPQPTKQTDLRVRHVGAVKYFNTEKGYGFIASEDEGEVFVHLSGVLDSGVRELEVGSPVEFEIEHTPRGPQAVDVIQLA